MSDPFDIQSTARFIISCLLLSLRVAPVFAFAPPFTLVRLPGTVRMLMGLGIAACLVGGGLPGAMFDGAGAGPIIAAAARELLIGMSFVMMFQIAFGAIYVAGRTVDIQAGFGLAMLIDPTTRSQTPLVGTLFAYAAASIFFAMGGHHDVLRLFAASLEAVPIGTANVPTTVMRVTSFLSVSFLIAFGVAGGAVLTLFLADLAIAVMSRTVPQMNVLLLGFQVKTILLLIVLASAFGGSGALLARLMAAMLSATAGILARG
jgi:flagellar biosynthetic protein FliR